MQATLPPSDYRSKRVQRSNFKVGVKSVGEFEKGNVWNNRLYREENGRGGGGDIKGDFRTSRLKPVL